MSSVLRRASLPHKQVRNAVSKLDVQPQWRYCARPAQLLILSVLDLDFVSCRMSASGAQTHAVELGSITPAQLKPGNTDPPRTLPKLPILVRLVASLTLWIAVASVGAACFWAIESGHELDQVRAIQQQQVLAGLRHLWPDGSIRRTPAPPCWPMPCLSTDFSFSYDEGNYTGPTGPGCTNQGCRWRSDGDCDDGGPGAEYAECDLGTDCTDCGVRYFAPPSPPGCSESCSDSSDGYCDDGGSGAEYSVCDLGTDCVDCGPREDTGDAGSGTVLSPPPSPPPPPPSPSPPPPSGVSFESREQPTVNASNYSWANHTSEPANLTLQLSATQALLDQFSSSCLQGPATDENDLKWNFAGSLFFALTIMTTIGYGTFAPATQAGRIFTMVFGVVGIMATGVVMGVLSNAIDMLLNALHQKVTRPSKDGVEEGRMAQMPVTFKAAMTVVILVLYILLAAAFAAAREGWTYDEAIYMVFITVTTIGLGDYSMQDSSVADVFLQFAVFIPGLAICAEFINLGNSAVADVDVVIIDKAVNVAERVSKTDLDGDGDIGIELSAETKSRTAKFSDA